MRQSTVHQLTIAAVAAVVLFAGLGTAHLWDQDEAFFARAAVEMHQRGDWVVPSFNDELFAHKPPLMFWMMRLGYTLFGVNEFAARFGSAVFGVATSLLVYRFGRRLFNADVGLWAGLATATALMFDVVGRAATPDSYLVFFSTLTLYLFARYECPAGSSSGPLPLSLCVGMYASMAMAVLVKGPIGILLPGSVIGLYLIVRDPIGDPKQPVGLAEAVGLRLLNVFPTVGRMRPFTAMAMVLLIAGPWFALVGWRTDGQFLLEFFGVHNYGRFLNAMDSHSGPIWYYIPAVLAGFFPWSIFGIPTTLDCIARCRGRDQWNSGAKFVACWVVVFVGFFSLASTKLPSYVLPAYPALALATGCFVDRWLRRPESVWRWWPRLSFASLLLVGVVLGVAGVVIGGGTNVGNRIWHAAGVSAQVQPELLFLGWLGAVLVVGAVGSLVLNELRQVRAAAFGLLTTAVLFATGLFAVVAVRVDAHQASPALAQAIRQHADGSPRVAQFGYLQPSLVYYANTRVEACKTPQRAVQFLRDNPKAFVVTTENYYSRLAPYLTGDISVVERQPQFPRAGTIMILGRVSEVAQTEASGNQ